MRNLFQTDTAPKRQTEPNFGPGVTSFRPTSESSGVSWSTRLTAMSRFVGRYSQYTWLLLVAGFFYLLLWLITQYVPPSSLANWLWPDSYLLIQLLFLAGNFFFFTFWLQSHQAGLWASLMIMVGLFFRLAHFVFTWPLRISLLVASAICWWWLVWWPRWRVRHDDNTSN